MNPNFRIYTNTDILGVELGGALKNVIALCAGILDGLGYGDNTKAALITRGMAEITRLGEAMGCKLQTFMGLAGIGDLIVTCTSRHSRNNRCGFLIGKGYSYEEAEKKHKKRGTYYSSDRALNRFLRADFGNKLMLSDKRAYYVSEGIRDPSGNENYAEAINADVLYKSNDGKRGKRRNDVRRRHKRAGKLAKGHSAALKYRNDEEVKHKYEENERHYEKIIRLASLQIIHHKIGYEGKRKCNHVCSYGNEKSLMKFENP